MIAVFIGYTVMGAFTVPGAWKFGVMTLCCSVLMVIVTLGVWFSSIQTIAVDLNKDRGTLHVETYCVKRGSSESLQVFRRVKDVEMPRIKEVYITKRLVSVFSDLCRCTIFALEVDSGRPTMLYRGIGTQEAEDIRGNPFSTGIMMSV
jgi:hypothetical protein